MASVTASCTMATSWLKRLMRSPLWWRLWKLGESTTSRSNRAQRRSAIIPEDTEAIR